MLVGFTFLGLVGIAAILVIGLFAAILIFEIAMFISVITNKSIPDNTKFMWIIGMVLVHPFVAIWYYFTDHRKRS